mgnify:CR=1 FL=1
MSILFFFMKLLALTILLTSYHLKSVSWDLKIWILWDLELEIISAIRFSIFMSRWSVFRYRILIVYKQKNPVFVNRIACAHEKTRTSKSLSSLHPECSVFTNFTTWALSFWYCAQDKSRTCTTHSSPPPQSGVSTNFTTWALIRLQRYSFFQYRNTFSEKFCSFFFIALVNLLFLKRLKTTIMLTEKDIQQLSERNITENQVLNQAEKLSYL